MSCTVAMANSPAFSPSRSRVSSPLFCKASSASPERSLPSPASPLRLIRLQKPPAVANRAGSTASSPKRKRPPMLDIPVHAGGFVLGGGGFTPAAAERMDAVEVEEEGYSVYCKRGRREALEDRFSAEVNLQGNCKQAFFGVFDGHGGAKAAEFAATNLKKNILEEVERREDDEEIEEAVKSGYLKTDSDFLKEDMHGGTCSVTVLLRDNHLIVSNSGDCRVVMSRGGVAEALTSDHRPSREDEKERIENLGGYVDCCRGVWRIQGSLAVSRGIGDGHLKQWVTAEPETKVLKIEPNFEFLILASDGLWDKVGNQEAVDMARPLCVGVQNPDMLSACKKLAALSVSRGSCDDITVMLIQLERLFNNPISAFSLKTEI